MGRIPIEVEGSSDYAIVASCCGGFGTNPGLAVFDGNTLESVDSRSSTGICVNDDHFFQLLQEPDSEGITQLVVYDIEGNVDSWSLKGVRDPHDVIWDGTHLILVSTDDNSVKWIASGGDVVREWKVQAEADAWHLNCLSLHDSQLFISAFGKFDEHRGWAKDTHRETGILIQPDTGQTVISGLVQPHSPRFLDGTWIICCSLSRELRQYTSTGQIMRRSEPLELYARGIAVTDDFLFVGESLSRNAEYTGADMAAGKTASIAVLSRDNWALVDRILVPSLEIYELLVVKKPLIRALRYQATVKRYEARIADMRHQADAEIMQTRRQADDELATAQGHADFELAEARRCSATEMERMQEIAESELAEACGRSAIEVERMQEIVGGLQWQIDWMKSSRAVRLVLKARAARTYLHQKGVLARIQHMVLSMVGKGENR